MIIVCQSMPVKCKKMKSSISLINNWVALVIATVVFIDIFQTVMTVNGVSEDEHGHVRVKRRSRHVQLGHDTEHQTDGE